MNEESLARASRAYASLLARYHGTLDLVSDAVMENLDRHIADAVAYARMIERLVGPSAAVVDVGSGAGLPGVIVAAALPNAAVHLVERRRRRGAFLEIAKGELGLGNATVHVGDVLRLTEVCADVITAQAVAEFGTLVKLTRHLHRRTCLLVSRRATGVEPAAMLAEAVTAARQLDEKNERAVPAGRRPGGAVAVTDWAQAEAAEEPLEERGSLIAVRLPGGTACQ